MSATLAAMTGDIRARLEQVHEVIAAAAARVQRDPADITLVAVSKKQPAQAILAGYAAGIRDVGENYAQELTAKMAEVAAQAAHQTAEAAAAAPSQPHSPGLPDLRWHFIGKLQRNKVKYLVGRVALIHAVDSLALAEEIDRIASRDTPGMRQRVLIAVNLGGEEQKSGIAPAELPELLAAMDQLDHVECAGLMTMPPLADNPEDSRPYFRALTELRERLRTAARPLPELSTGTTGDFGVAVEEGATLVRVGTAVFGPRPG